MKTLGKIFIGLLFIMTLPVLAQTQPVLNSISYRLSAQTWVKSNSAQVVVAVDATMNADQLAKARVGIVNKLSEMMPSVQWNMMAFNHSKDQSGLLRLQAQLIARLSADQVDMLTNKISSVSKAGENFSIASVNYKPSLVAMEKAQATLRAQIMQQVQQNLVELNKQSKTHYFLHNLNFQSMQPIFRTMLVRMPTVVATQPMPVSTHLTLMANVVLSSVQPTK